MSPNPKEPTAVRHAFARPGHQRPLHRTGLFLAALVLAAALPTQFLAAQALPASAANIPSATDSFEPGSPGLGDPYFPLDGNGGYDVRHYLLDLSYDPATGLLAGSATISARATQNLSAFNLDLEGLTVRSVRVDDEPAAFSRSGAELTVTPQDGIADDDDFKAIVAYDGVPKAINGQLGTSGFFHTDDGSLVIGQPHVAATWFPANDHPLDKASFTFRITVPEGLEVVANGVLRERESEQGKTTWTWRAEAPMATYLATANVGQFNLRQYRDGRISFVDAIDPDLFTPVVTPRTGNSFAWSHNGNRSYTRLTRSISVPPGGARLSFWLWRNIEAGRDFTFVEARTAGAQDWTTLPDANGHTAADTGRACQELLALHPFLTHYQTVNGQGTCRPTGTSGKWWAATGQGTGWEQWAVDLAHFAGKKVEVSVTYASDAAIPFDGVSVDDVAVSTGDGTTSFEDDGNTLDGWAASGAPTGSPPGESHWTAGREGPPSLGQKVQSSFKRQPEIIRFLSGYLGPYPFNAAGGIVDDVKNLGFALENQTRPIYSKLFFNTPTGGDSVVVHELAHQWVGDDVAVRAWRDIWLNEGFATYAEWLWSESEGRDTPQQIFDFYATAIPPEAPFWSVKIGDPGTKALFDFAVYARGAMTLHALRTRVGDEVFFDILREWTESHAGGNVSSEDFMNLAQQLSGQDLRAFFTTWLFSPTKPAELNTVVRKSVRPGGTPETARLLEQRLGAGLKPR
jgi:hypothetical protein